MRLGLSRCGCGAERRARGPGTHRRDGSLQENDGGGGRRKQLGASGAVRLLREQRVKVLILSPGAANTRPGGRADARAAA